MAIVLQVKKNDVDFRTELEKMDSSYFEVLETQGFDGTQDFFSYLLYLTPLSIPYIAKVMIAQIQSKGSVRIVANGIEIHGVSEDKVIEILSQLSGVNRENQARSEHDQED